MSATEDDLVARIRQGDAAALAEFIDRRRPALLAFIRQNLIGLLRAKVEPDDVLQEVAVSALRALPSTDLTDQDPFGWLCHQARQRLVDAHRKYVSSQKRAADREVPLNTGADSSMPALEQLLAASLTTPSEALSRDQRQQRLLAALATLPEESRTALRLRYGEGLPTRDIAGQLGKSDGAVRVLLSRSLARLRQLLDTETN